MVASTEVNDERKIAREMAALTMIPAFAEAAKHDPVGARMAASLSARERVLVGCVADAMGNEELGSYLNITLDTVRKHLFNIFDKLGVGTRTELAVAVYRKPALRAAVPIPSLMAVKEG